MEPIREHSSLVAAEYKFIDLSDSESDDDLIGITRNSGIVVQGDNHVYIRCVDEIALVQLRLRFMSGRSHDALPGWQYAGQGKLMILSGTLTVYQWGPNDPPEWKAPFTGEASITVSHRGRDKIIELMSQVESRARSQKLSAREKSALIHELDGTEQYLIEISPAVGEK